VENSSFYVKIGLWILTTNFTVLANCYEGR
jgi:hypothetical protein